jgi:NADPH:quinone reductase-like Zn-dependent oxidoreductase
LKAWIGERSTSGTRYQLADLPDPVPGPEEVLLRVHAAGLNLADRFPKRSHFEHSPAAPAPIPGLEAAGEIVALGPAVQRHHVGERVMAMLHGACAPYACVHQSLLMRIPLAMSWTDAAAVPVSFLTAHDALVTNGRLEHGASVLVLGATTGVGLAAIQIARRHGAALVAGSSRSAAKLERARELGLDLALLDAGAGVADRVLEATSGRGADVVLDHLGGRVLHDTLRATAVGGRIVNVGRFAGTRGEIDLELLSLRRISLIGVSFRTRSLAEHAAVVSRFVAQHGADLASGALRPVVDRVYEFSDLPAAIERAACGAQFGKLVLTI